MNDKEIIKEAWKRFGLHSLLDMFLWINKKTKEEYKVRIIKEIKKMKHSKNVISIRYSRNHHLEVYNGALDAIVKLVEENE